jgi:hypothetical protein
MKYGTSSPKRGPSGANAPSDSSPLRTRSDASQGDRTPRASRGGAVGGKLS